MTWIAFLLNDDLKKMLLKKQFCNWRNSYQGQTRTYHIIQFIMRNCLCCKVQKLNKAAVQFSHNYHKHKAVDTRCNLCTETSKLEENRSVRNSTSNVVCHKCIALHPTMFWPSTILTQTIRQSNKQKTL